MMFESQRLIYRAVESPQDDDFCYVLRLDHVAVGNSNATLHKPPSKASAADIQEYLSKKALIGAMICLKPVSTSEAPPPAAAQVPTPVGQIHLQNSPEGDRHHRHSTIGISIASAYQGQGYGSEAIEWILQWGFEVAGLHRIAIGCFSWNEGAARLYKRMGFIEEGREREIFWHEGKWGDAINFAMLEEEWRMRKER